MVAPWVGIREARVSSAARRNVRRARSCAATFRSRAGPSPGSWHGCSSSWSRGRSAILRRTRICICRARRTTAAHPEIQDMGRNGERAADGRRRRIAQPFKTKRSGRDDDENPGAKQQAGTEMAMMPPVCSDVAHDADDRRRADKQPLDPFVHRVAQSQEREQAREHRQGETMNGAGRGHDDAGAIPARRAVERARKGVNHAVTLPIRLPTTPRLLDSRHRGPMTGSSRCTSRHGVGSIYLRHGCG